MSELRKHLAAGLQAVTECFGSLCNLDLTSTLPQATHVGPAALEAVGTTLVWCETHILKGEQRVGMVMTEKLAKRLGVGMLMLPIEPETMTEELMMALDEAINVAIGVWNHAVVDETMFWDNSVSARSIRTRPYEESVVDCAEHSLGVVLGHIHVGGEAHPVAIFGHGTWPAMEGFDPPKPPRDMKKLGPTTQMLLSQALGIEAPRPAGPAPRPAPAAAPAPAPAPRQAPDRPRITPGPDGHEPAHAASGHVDHNHDHEEQLGAMLVLVDRTGALRAWLSEQLRNPEFTFLKTTGSIREQHECRALVLVEPTDLEHAAIRAGRMLIMDRA